MPSNTDITVVEVVDSHELVPRSSVATQGMGVRRIPRHVLPYTLTLVVNGEPHPISDAHAAELQTFASVNQKNGTVTNSGDRSAALVALMPEGRFACIDLDNPDSIPQRGPRR